jgi:hypothetical protein
MSQDAVTARDQQCTCGHTHEAHEHYRRGSDCALCPAGSCVRFTPAADGGSASPFPAVETPASTEVPLA